MWWVLCRRWPRVNRRNDDKVDLTPIDRLSPRALLGGEFFWERNPGVASRLRRSLPPATADDPFGVD